MIHSKNRFESWLPALFDGQFDWDFLLPAWSGTKIQPMDFDAVVERRGHYLIFETKIPGQNIPIGQAITLAGMWAKGATIFVVHGKSPDEITGLAVYPEGKYDGSKQLGEKNMEAINAFDLVYRSRCWFCWASGLAVPTRDEWDRQLWLWDYERASA